MIGLFHEVTAWSNPPSAPRAEDAKTRRVSSWRFATKGSLPLSRRPAPVARASGALRCHRDFLRGKRGWRTGSRGSWSQGFGRSRGLGPQQLVLAERLVLAEQLVSLVGPVPLGQPVRPVRPEKLQPAWTAWPEKLRLAWTTRPVLEHVKSPTFRRLGEHFVPALERRLSKSHA